MRVPATLALLLLSSSPFLADVSSAQLTPHPGDALPLGCPVSLDVRHGRGDPRLLATAAQAIPASTAENTQLQPGRSSAPGGQQTIDLTIRNEASHAVALVDGIVQTQAHDGRFLNLPAGNAPGLGQEQSFSLHLFTHIDAHGEKVVSWRLPTLDIVSSVTIQRVTYQDGTTWVKSAHGSASRECSFSLDPVTLVTQR